MASIRTSRSGTHQVRYRDPNGRQRSRNFTRKTDATRFAASVETDKIRGDWLDPRLGKVTFADWADEWLGQLGHLKPKTRLDYEINLRRHVLPLLGDAPVGSIDRPAMKTFTSDLTAGGAGPAVVRIAAQVARHVLSVAVDAGALKANPASALRLVRQHKSEMLFLRPEEVHALAGAIAPPYATLIRFAAYTGLRAGEIGALRVKRIDFRRGRVEVAEAVSDVAGQLIVGPTKTYANRHVPMPPRLLEELSTYLGPRRDDREALVFTGPQGGPLRHGNFYKSKFKPAVRAAGLPEGLRFHDYADLRVVPTQVATPCSGR